MSAVDKFRLDGYTVNVVFRDPFKKITDKYPDFTAKTTRQKMSCSLMLCIIILVCFSGEKERCTAKKLCPDWQS